MKLLSFVARNHRSFRDEFFLDLTRATLQTNVPGAGEEWKDHLYPVAAIFGANASGKTSLIRALHYVKTAVASSSTHWLDNEKMAIDPFRLSSQTIHGPSFYALDFVLPISGHYSHVEPGEYRFNYEFEVSEAGVGRELLLMYRTAKPTTLIERTWDPHNPTVKLGMRLGTIEVSERELVLSRALQVKKGVLSEVAYELCLGINTFGVGDRQHSRRLSLLTKELDEKPVILDELVALARVADVGIETLCVEEDEAPEEIADLLRILNERAVRKDKETASARTERSSSKTQEETPFRLVAPSLRFGHRAEPGMQPEGFRPSDESSGTLAWLSIATQAVEALREGTLLCIDELDTSLHPYLAALVISLFQSKETNPHGAQLIFTSHDVSLLSPQSGADLDVKQVWYVDKDNHGNSELYSLADFSDIKKGSNIFKQYMEGRFGAVPRTAPALMHSLIHRTDDEEPANTVER